MLGHEQPPARLFAMRSRLGLASCANVPVVLREMRLWDDSSLRNSWPHSTFHLRLRITELKVQIKMKQTHRWPQKYLYWLLHISVTKRIQADYISVTFSLNNIHISIFSPLLLLLNWFIYSIFSPYSWPVFPVVCIPFFLPWLPMLGSILLFILTYSPLF